MWRVPGGMAVSAMRAILEFERRQHGRDAHATIATNKRHTRVQVGFHIWHANSFSPFFRAEQDYQQLAQVADFLKIVLYNNCAGPRYVQAINSIHSTIFGDVPKDELLQLYNHLLNYGDEKPLDQLPTAGLSADYVARETRRALDDVQGKCAVYPGDRHRRPHQPQREEDDARRCPRLHARGPQSRGAGCHLLTQVLRNATGQPLRRRQRRPGILKLSETPDSNHLRRVFPWH